MRIPATAAALLLVTAPAFAQGISLADVARKEHARRAGLVKTAKVYTNADLAPAIAEPPPSAQPSIGGFESVSTGTKVSADEILARTLEQVGDKAEVTENEAAWRARAAAFRNRLEAAKKDLTAVDQPSASVNPREQRALDNLRQRARRRLEQAEEAWRMFETEADAAKIPTHWITPPQ